MLAALPSQTAGCESRRAGRNHQYWSSYRSLHGYETLDSPDWPCIQLVVDASDAGTVSLTLGSGCCSATCLEHACEGNLWLPAPPFVPYTLDLTTSTLVGVLRSALSYGSA